MRANATVHVSPADRKRLEALVADRNTPAKVVWRAGIILATADGHGTNEIMRRSGKSKPCVWRWQERFAAEGVDGLTRDKTRPSRKPPRPHAARPADEEGRAATMTHDYVTAKQPCSRRWTSGAASSSANVSRGTARRSSCASCAASIAR